jgi:hypothetical protein
MSREWWNLVLFPLLQAGRIRKRTRIVTITLWCDLPQGAPSGRGRRRVYSDQVWTPQDKWQQRTGWQRVPLVVRGREVHLRVKVEVRVVGWDGARGCFS